jgi:microcystin-dependent protein
MADPFLGEIRAFGFNWPATGWALCDGSILQINQHAALASLLGNTFGGDGRTTFALPDLRGRTPMHANPQQGLMQGNAGGLEQVTLTTAQIPAHAHTVTASGATAERSSLAATPPSYLGATAGGSSYAPAAGATLTSLDPSTVKAAGGNAPHQNMQPSLVINFCIATTGIYPTRP